MERFKDEPVVIWTLRVPHEIAADVKRMARDKKVSINSEAVYALWKHLLEEGHVGR